MRSYLEEKIVAPVWKTENKAIAYPSSLPHDSLYL
jgi:hypothetical protein